MLSKDGTGWWSLILVYWQCLLSLAWSPSPTDDIQTGGSNSALLGRDPLSSVRSGANRVGRGLGAGVMENILIEVHTPAVSLFSRYLMEMGLSFDRRHKVNWPCDIEWKRKVWQLSKCVVANAIACDWKGKHLDWTHKDWNRIPNFFVEFPKNRRKPGPSCVLIGCCPSRIIRSLFVLGLPGQRVKASPDFRQERERADKNSPARRVQFPIMIFSSEGENQNTAKGWKQRRVD